LGARDYLNRGRIRKTGKCARRSRGKARGNLELNGKAVLLIQYLVSNEDNHKVHQILPRSLLLSTKGKKESAGLEGEIRISLPQED